MAIKANGCTSSTMLFMVVKADLLENELKTYNAYLEFREKSITC